MRCFVAAPLDPLLSEAVVSAAATLKASGASVKWVEPRNLHFTLKFLGEIPESGVIAARRAVERAVKGRGRFTISLRGAGVFPASGPPRVVWIGLGSGGETLTALARGIEGEMRREGFPSEKKGFTPHLTLGRAREPAGSEALKAAVARMRDTSFGSMDVWKISLVTSDLTPRGPLYTTIEEWRLER